MSERYILVRSKIGRVYVAYRSTDVDKCKAKFNQVSRFSACAMYDLASGNPVVNYGLLYGSKFEALKDKERTKYISKLKEEQAAKKLQTKKTNKTSSSSNSIKAIPPSASVLDDSLTGTPIRNTEQDKLELVDATNYYYGENGCKKDVAQAFIKFRQLANAGNATAMNYLGDMYKNGIGTTKNIPFAVSSYRRSAMKGNKYGMYNLGCCYEAGIGVMTSLLLADKYYDLAAKLGFAQAIDAKETVTKLLNNASKTTKANRMHDMDKAAPSKLSPLFGWESLPTVSLEEAINTLIEADVLVPYSESHYEYAKFYVEDLIKRGVVGDELTVDEAAAVHLYTQEWMIATDSLYLLMNKMLRSTKRQTELPHWFGYIKLFMTGLKKMPTNENSLTLLRGINYDCEKYYKEGDVFNWWSFSSFTATMDTFTDSNFLGNGGSTLFKLTNATAYSVAKYSQFVDEDEYIVLPGAHFKVQKIYLDGKTRIIEIEQLYPTKA